MYTPRHTHRVTHVQRIMKTNYIDIFTPQCLWCKQSLTQRHTHHLSSLLTAQGNDSAPRTHTHDLSGQILFIDHGYHYKEPWGACVSGGSVHVSTGRCVFTWLAAGTDFRCSSSWWNDGSHQQRLTMLPSSREPVTSETLRCNKSAGFGLIGYWSHHVWSVLFISSLTFCIFARAASAEWRQSEAVLLRTVKESTTRFV